MSLVLLSNFVRIYETKTRRISEARYGASLNQDVKKDVKQKNEIERRYKGRYEDSYGKHTQYNTKYDFTMCDLSPVWTAKDLPHTSQLKGLSPVCVRR